MEEGRPAAADADEEEEVPSTPPVFESHSAALALQPRICDAIDSGAGGACNVGEI